MVFYALHYHIVHCDMMPDNAMLYNMMFNDIKCSTVKEVNVSINRIKEEEKNEKEWNGGEI